MGETGDQAGRDKEAAGKTGQSGNKEGAGSKSKPGEKGTKPSPNESGTSAGGAGQKGKPTPPEQDPSGAGATNGSVTGGGAASEGDAQTGGSAEAARDRRYGSREPGTRQKSTDLTLKYLKDQKDNPDPELLKRMGWSKDDLRAFVDRWESLKKSAKEDAASKGELDDAYRSLGLRGGRQTQECRQGGRRHTRAQRLRRTQRAPSGYAEQFKAFRKGAGRK